MELGLEGQLVNNGLSRAKSRVQLPGAKMQLLPAKLQLAAGKEQLAGGKEQLLSKMNQQLSSGSSAAAGKNRINLLPAHQV